MKEKLFLFGLIFLLAGGAYADVQAPVWSDVAPVGRANIDTSKNYFRPMAKYWQERRVRFENSINSCQTQFAGEELASCYNGIVELEKSKNQMREMQMSENSRSILREQ